MGGRTKQEPRRQRINFSKLERASRELAEVATKLGALSQFDASTPRTEITDDLMEKIEKWRQQNIE